MELIKFFFKDEGGGGKKRSGKNTQKNYTKEIFITQKTNKYLNQIIKTIFF